MTIALNDRSSALSLLLTRRSAKARYLEEPGPDDAQIATLMDAAARVPDHGKLGPWRFVIINDRARFSELLRTLALKENPDTRERDIVELQEFAHLAPFMAAILFVPEEGRIPLWEQQLSTGAAAQNMLLAAHAMGFGANWLTTKAAYLPGVADELGFPGGQVAGFIFVGSHPREYEERPRPPAEARLSTF